MNSPQPTIRSGLKIPFLDGSNDHLVFSREHWNLIIASVNSFLASNNWTVTNHGVILDVPKSGGVTGWFWSSPIELPAAPYPAFLKGAVIHIQSAHAIVTSGIRDAADPAGPLVGSRPGKWIALQPVPAQATVSGNAVWNLPQWPLPVPSSWDNAANFWDFIPDASPCT